jgi:hypothetical protein
MARLRALSLGLVTGFPGPHRQSRIPEPPVTLPRSPSAKAGQLEGSHQRQITLRANVDRIPMSDRAISRRRGRGRMGGRLGRGAPGHCPVAGKQRPRLRGDCLGNRGVEVCDLEVEVHHRALLPGGRRPHGGLVTNRLLEHDIDGPPGSDEDRRAWLFVTNSPPEQRGVEPRQRAGVRRLDSGSPPHAFRPGSARHSAGLGRRRDIWARP